MYKGKVSRYQISLASACLHPPPPSAVITPGMSGFAVNYVERAWAEWASLYSLPVIHVGLAKSQESLSFAPNQSLASQPCHLRQALFSDQIDF